jgi:outer membrane protein assembly factor BamB
MFRPRSLVLVLMAGVTLIPAVARADWLSYGRDYSHSGRTEETIKAPLGVLWKFASRPYYGLPANSPQTVNAGSPIVVGQTIYFASRDRLYAVDRATGEMKWRYPSGDEAASTIRSTPTYSDGVIYIGANDGYFYALDAETGSQKWVFRTTGSVRSHPVVIKTSPTDPGIVIFGSDDDILYAINTAGELQWKYSLARDDIASALAYSPDTGFVYFIGSDLMIHAVHPATNKRKWQARVPIAQLNVSPVIFEDKLFMAAGTAVNRYSLRNGTLNVTQFMGANEIETDISTTVIVTDDPDNRGNTNAGLLYFGDRNGNFYCGTFKGERRWKTRLDARVISMPVLTGDVLYAGTEKGFVYALDAKTGGILWAYRSEAPRDYQVQYRYHNISAPLVADGGQLLVLGDDGTLTCFTSEAIDASAPILSTPRPDRGTVMNGTPPLTVSAYLWDEGSGINPATVTVFLDGQQQQPGEEPYYKKGSAIKPGVTYDPLNRRVEFSTAPGAAGQRVSPLSDGRHTVRVQAADWKGNVGTMEWTFMVDNSLPIRKRPTTAPANRPGGLPGTSGGYGLPGSGGALPGGYPGAGPGGGFGTQTRPGQNRGRGPAGRRR